MNSTADQLVMRLYGSNKDFIIIHIGFVIGSQGILIIHKVDVGVNVVDMSRLLASDLLVLQGDGI